MAPQPGEPASASDSSVRSRCSKLCEEHSRYNNDVLNGTSWGSIEYRPEQSAGQYPRAIYYYEKSSLEGRSVWAGPTVAEVIQNQSNCGLCALVYRAIKAEHLPSEVHDNPTLLRSGELGVQTLVSVDVEGLAAESFKSKASTPRRESGEKRFDFDPKYVKEPLAWLTAFSASDQVEEVSRCFSDTEALEIVPETRCTNIRERVEACLREHVVCRRTLTGVEIDESETKTPLPTRVIHIPADARGKPHLVESRGRNDRYVALSYCWGTSDEYKPLATTRADVVEFRSELPVADLPKTIQDAITVTRELGFAFLWVDSLCIIQDDSDDWAKEACAMSQVYTYAALTIAPVSANRGKDGFLWPPIPDSVYLPYLGKASEQIGEFVLRSQDFIWNGGGSFVTRDLSQSRWNTRAWTLQEKHLSRRVLYFGSTAIYMECQSGFWVEGLESQSTLHEEKLEFFRALAVEQNVLNASFDVYFNTGNLPRFLDPQGAFGRMVGKAASSLLQATRMENGDLDLTTLVRDYTRRGLTVSTDKLIAFQGLALALAALTGQEYHAGIFTKNVAKNLFWCSADHSLTRPQQGMHVPSWSWASWSGEIRFWDRSVWEWHEMPVLGQTGYLGALKKAMFKQAPRQTNFTYGTELVTLELTADVLPVMRLQVTLAVIEKKQDWYDHDVEMLPRFWPEEYASWGTDRTFFLTSGSRSNRSWWSPASQTDIVQCPVCGEDIRATGDGEILQQVAQCNSNAPHRTTSNDVGSVIGVACFDDPEQEPPSSLEAVILWSFSETENPNDDLLRPGNSETPREARDDDDLNSERLDIGLQLRALEQGKWRQRLPDMAREYVRRLRLFNLLLIKKTDDGKGTYRRVGVGLAFHIAGLARFGGLSLHREATTRKIVLV